MVQIETTARWKLEPLPKNVLITTGHEADCRWANKVWTTPHAFGQAERYEAELAHMLVGDPRPLDAAIWIKVTVVDVYNRRYRRCCRLVHK